MSYDEFWPVYLRAHSKEGTRVLHAVGTLAGSGLFIGALALQRLDWLIASVAAAYGLAWGSHFLIEGNRPATFGHPLWSVYSDLRMIFLMLSGGLEAELEKAGVR